MTAQQTIRFAGFLQLMIEQQWHGVYLPKKAFY